MHSFSHSDSVRNDSATPLDNDPWRLAKYCNDSVHKIYSQPFKWTPWLGACEPLRLAHADYYRSPLNKYYALIVTDSSSSWPEVYFTTSPISDFIIAALRAIFSLAGVPSALVMNSGSNFTTQQVDGWLKSVGCHHVLTPRNRQSSGITENSGHTKAPSSQSKPAYLMNFTDEWQIPNSLHAATASSPTK